MHILLMIAVSLLSMVSPLRAETVTEAARVIEAELGGRVGVLLLQPGVEPLVQWRADERFPMSSTFKAPLCGVVLKKVEAGEEQLGRVISYKADDLVPYSPVTETRSGQGMSIAELCTAAITLSDNTAGNLLLATLGGPEGFTRYLRSLGDQVTRLDRWETDLNEGLPDDPRDTTTPQAMLATLETLLFSDVLSSDGREQLEGWMERDQVADLLIRASLPNGWRISDKTGAGGHGSRSIVAVMRTPGGSPWLAAIYLTGGVSDMAARNHAIARIGEAMVDEIIRQDQATSLRFVLCD